MKGHLDVVKFLVQNGADKNVHSNEDETPLLVASTNNHDDVVIFLTNQTGGTGGTITVGCGTKDGPVANKPCVFPFNYGGTKYSKCTTEGNKGKLWCSTEVDAFGDYVKNKWGNCDSNCGKITTPGNGRPSNNQGNNDVLISEASKGSTRIVMRLIKNNANKDYQDQNGRTALIAAAEGGHEQLVTQLINSGVNVNLKKNNGISALHLEAQNGHLQNVQAILQQADNINALAPYNFKKNYTPLIFAAMKGHKQVVSLLLQSGANVRLKTQDGFNAILWAAKK